MLCSAAAPVGRPAALGLASARLRRVRSTWQPAVRASVTVGSDGGSSPPAESSPFDALVARAPTWAALRTAHVTATARFVGQSGEEAVALKARCVAASRLGPDTAYEVMDASMDVVAVYSAAYDGSLSICADVVDAHARFLADALLTGSATAVAAGYAALDALPPMLRRQHTAGTAAVGAAALLALREDAELLRSMLALTDSDSDAADDEARSEAAAAAALCDAVDAVIAAMPQPQEDAPAKA